MRIYVYINFLTTIGRLSKPWWHVGWSPDLSVASTWTSWCQCYFAKGWIPCCQTNSWFGWLVGWKTVVNLLLRFQIIFFAGSTCWLLQFHEIPNVSWFWPTRSAPTGWCLTSGMLLTWPPPCPEFFRSNWVGGVSRKWEEVPQIWVNLKTTSLFDLTGNHGLFKGNHPLVWPNCSD